MGNHAELMKKEGLYYQLIMNQKIAEDKGKGIGIIMFYTCLHVCILFALICFGRTKASLICYNQSSTI